MEIDTKKSHVNYKNLDAIKKSLIASGNRLKISDFVTQETLDVALKKVAYPSLAKISFTLPNNEIKEYVISAVIRGQTKGISSDEIMKNTRALWPKGQTMCIDSSNQGIDEISKILHPELKTIKTTGNSSKIDGIFLRTNDLYDEKKTKVAFFAISVSNLKEEGRGRSGKKLSSIQKYLELGACFIFLIRINQKIACFYILTPEDLNDFKKDIEGSNPDSEFRPNPFLLKQRKNSFPQKMDKYKIVLKNQNYQDFFHEIKMKILNFEETASIRQTMEYLTNSKSMLSTESRKEMAYMNSLKKNLPQMEIIENPQQGDFKYLVSDKLVICEVKKASISTGSDAYYFNLRGESKLIPNYNKIDLYIIAMPNDRDHILNIHSKIEVEQINEKLCDQNHYSTFIFLSTRNDGKFTINRDIIDRHLFHFTYDPNSLKFQSDYFFQGKYMIVKIDNLQTQDKLFEFLLDCHNEVQLTEEESQKLKQFNPKKEHEKKRKQKLKLRDKKRKKLTEMK